MGLPGCLVRVGWPVVPFWGVLFGGECVAIVCEESAVFVELTPAGTTAEMIELYSDLIGSAILLGRAEKRTERAFVVVGVGESLAACDTELVRTAGAEEAASELGATKSLASELARLSNVPRKSTELAAGAASLAAMKGVGSGASAMLMCFWLSPAFGDPNFTLAGLVVECVAVARESRKSGEVRED